MRAGMDKRVVDDKVAALGQRGEKRGVGGKAGGEEKRGLGAVVTGGGYFERFMFGVVAAQQARSAGTGRDALGNALDKRVAQRGRLGEAEIIVGGEIEPLTRGEAAKPVLCGERIELALKSVEQRNRSYS